MNHNEAEKILRASVAGLSEPLKSAIEFTLTNFYQPSAADEAKNFLAGLPSMTTDDAELKAKIDAAYFTLMNTPEVWLDIKDLPHEEWRDIVGYERHYQISNFGRVKSLKKVKPIILRMCVHSRKVV